MLNWFENRQLLNVKISDLILLIADSVLMPQIYQIWSLIQDFSCFIQITHLGKRRQRNAIDRLVHHVTLLDNWQ